MVGAYEDVKKCDCWYYMDCERVDCKFGFQVKGSPYNLVRILNLEGEVTYTRTHKHYDEEEMLISRQKTNLRRGKRASKMDVEFPKIRKKVEEVAEEKVTEEKVEEVAEEKVAEEKVEEVDEEKKKKVVKKKVDEEKVAEEKVEEVAEEKKKKVVKKKDAKKNAGFKIYERKVNETVNIQLLH
jgi:hypothetical protein